MNDMSRFQATNKALNALMAPCPETDAILAFGRARQKVQMAEAILKDAFEDMANNGGVSWVEEDGWLERVRDFLNENPEDDIKAWEDEYRDVNGLPERV